MYVIVAGGGKVGSNVTRSLIDLGHEVTLIEQRSDRFRRLEEEFGPAVIRGDATEIGVLERAGIGRPPELLLAVTGDDEDNLVISQIAKEAYGVRKAIARVNDPRNQQHFDLLGITQTVCATTSILGLVEHEVPEHGLVQLLELQKEGLVVVEVQVEGSSPAAGKKAGGIALPPDRASSRSSGRGVRSSSSPRRCFVPATRCSRSCRGRPRWTSAAPCSARRVSGSAAGAQRRQ